MTRKDVTPKNSKSFIRRFGTGLLGGVVGGALAFGGTFWLTNDYSNNSSLDTNQTTSGQSTQATNVNYNVSSDVTQAVEKVQGAVVSILNLQSSNSGSDGFWDYFGDTPGGGQDDTLTTASEGSGVIYKKENGKAYIVTNNHVVEGQKGLQVLLRDGTKVDATLVGKDSFTDLAVLTIPDKNVDTVATFGNSDNLKIGEPALAIGSPLGSEYANSVTQGIISSVNRPVQNTNDSGELVSINAIQTDAAINPGNSGGALVNIKGQVIGINSSKIAASGSGVSVEGMGFAIPSNEVVTVIEALEKDGHVIRPAMGVTMLDLSVLPAQQREQLNLPSDVTEGVIIRSVKENSPASAAGLKQFDVITDFDGNVISDSTDLRTILYQKKLGDKVKVTYYRDGKKKTTTLDLTMDQSELTSQTN